MALLRFVMRSSTGSALHPHSSPQETMERKRCTEWSEVKRPHFFKILLADFPLRLRIPPNFLKHITEEPSEKPNISEETSEAAVLEGPSGRTWQVEMEKTREGTFLTSGWPKFVEGHSLREHEFLVFRYNGNMRFTVLIFDTNACEREDLFSRNCCDVEPTGHPRKKLVPDIVKKEESNEESLALPWRGNHASNQLIWCADSAPTQFSGSLISSCSINAVKTKPTAVRHRRYASRRRPVTDEERRKAREAALSFRSAFPYFILPMSISHVYWASEMRFPVGFSRLHLPRERTDMVLRDPANKTWMVVYIPSMRDRLSRGWSVFVRANSLDEGDHCAFELTGPVEFRVHIFRVVDEVVPLDMTSRTQGMTVVHQGFSGK